MEVVLGMILISCLVVDTIRKSVIWLHKGIKNKQFSEIFKGTLSLCILAVCLGIACWFGSMVYNISKMSEAIS